MGGSEEPREVVAPVNDLKISAAAHADFFQSAEQPRIAAGRDSELNLRKRGEAADQLGSKRFRTVNQIQDAAAVFIRRRGTKLLQFGEPWCDRKAECFRFFPRDSGIPKNGGA